MNGTTSLLARRLSFTNAAAPEQAASMPQQSATASGLRPEVWPHMHPLLARCDDLSAGLGVRGRQWVGQLMTSLRISLGSWRSGTAYKLQQPIPTTAPLAVTTPLMATRTTGRALRRIATGSADTIASRRQTDHQSNSLHSFADSPLLLAWHISDLLPFQSRIGANFSSTLVVVSRLLASPFRRH